MNAKPVAYSYVRFSTPEQRKGDSLRRQSEAAREWCERHGVTLDTATTLHDLGKSAFTGAHRSNPDRHALAAFLKLVEGGRVTPGSYLIIESLDRLTREHVRAGLMLLLGLIEAGIRIVQLSPSELVYDEKADEMALMLAIVELSRGHRESKRKSDLSGPAWRQKKEGAREGRTVTERLPAWVALKGDKRVLIPDRAKTVRLIFRLAAGGYGTPRIVAKLNRDGVPPIGKTGKWVKGYVGKILRDRRAVGEYQPRKGKRREPDGPPVANYFPPVVTEEEFLAARAGASERGQFRGRVGTQTVNVFAGLIRNARGGDSYYMTSRVERGMKYHVLVTNESQNGRSPCWSFPYPALERAVLSLLAEVKPHEVMGREDAPDELQVISGRLQGLESSIGLIEAEMDEHGESPTLFRRLRAKEGERRELLVRRDEAKQRAAHPLSAAWGEAHSLLSAIDAAPDPEDMRLRLRTVLRRVVSEAWLLVVPRRLVRLATVQIYFAENGHRDYLIYYRPRHHSYGGRKEAVCLARSLPPDFAPAGIDLRRPEDAVKLAAALEAVDLDALLTLMRAPAGK